MKYMLQVRFNGADLAINELPAEQRQAIFAEFEAIGRLPGVLDGNQLQPVSTAKTVRAPEGPAACHTRVGRRLKRRARRLLSVSRV